MVMHAIVPSAHCALVGLPCTKARCVAGRVVGTPALNRGSERVTRTARHGLAVRATLEEQPRLGVPTPTPPTAAAAALRPSLEQPPTWQQRLARWTGMLGLAVALAFSSAGAAWAARSGGRMGGSSFGGSRYSSSAGSSGWGSSAGSSGWSSGAGSSWGSSSRSRSPFRSSWSSSPLGGGLGSSPLGGGFGRATLPSSTGSVRANAFFLSPFGEPRQQNQPAAVTHATPRLPGCLQGRLAALAVAGRLAGEATLRATAAPLLAPASSRRRP